MGLFSFLWDTRGPGDAASAHTRELGWESSLSVKSVGKTGAFGAFSSLALLRKSRFFPSVEDFFILRTGILPEGAEMKNKKQINAVWRKSEQGLDGEELLDPQPRGQKKKKSLFLIFLGIIFCRAEVTERPGAGFMM